MNYYPFHVGDYASATQHLTLEEDGMYRRLLDISYTTEKPLPKDERQLFRLTRASTDAHREAMLTVLHEFFEETESGWTSKRVASELSVMQEKQQMQRDKANKRWHKPSIELGTPTALPRHQDQHATASKDGAEAMPPTPTPTPIPKRKNTSAIAPPDGVSDSVWHDFLKIRAAKKAPMTETALDGIRAEALIAGIDLSAALKICCARGWQGFKAKWLDEKYSSPYGSQSQTGAAWDGAR